MSRFSRFSTVITVKATLKMSGASKLIGTQSPGSVATFGRAGSLAPWRVTGPVSHADWKDVPVAASDYRSASPVTGSSAAKVPHASQERIYNVRYFCRDSRRAALGENSLVSVAACVKNELELAQRVAEHISLNCHFNTQGTVTSSSSSRVPLMDNPSGGFT